MSDPVLHTEPFRLRVLMALTQCLQEITPANGYGFDLGGSVFRGRDAFGDSDPVPMVSILEPPLPVEQIISPRPATGSTGQWDLLIQGFVEDDHDNPSDPAHRLMADVKRRLAVEKRRRLSEHGGPPNPFGMGHTNGRGNVVTEIIIGPGVVRPPGDGVSNKAYFWLTLTLKIAEDIEQPFL